MKELESEHRHFKAREAEDRGAREKDRQVARDKLQRRRASSSNRGGGDGDGQEAPPVQLAPLSPSAAVAQPDFGALLSTPSQKSNTVAGSGGDEVVEGPTPEVVKREVVKRIASEQEHFARLQSESQREADALQASLAEKKKQSKLRRSSLRNAPASGESGGGGE